MTTLKLKTGASIARSEAELFETDNMKRFHMRKKGQISNPKWLQRDNGSDFVTIKNQQDLKDFEQYLAHADERLFCAYYNVFSTGHDKNGNRIIGLYDQDESGDNKKIAMVCIFDNSLTMALVELVETYCGEDF